MPYLAAIDDTESPAFTVYVDELVPVDDELVGLLVLVEPDTFNTWFGNIILEDKLFKDFNFEIDIPYLLDIDQRDSPLFYCVCRCCVCLCCCNSTHCTCPNDCSNNFLFNYLFLLKYSIYFSDFYTICIILLNMYMVFVFHDIMITNIIFLSN